MKEVIEIKGNLHLYDVPSQVFSETEMACTLCGNGIDLTIYCGRNVDNLEDINMNYKEFLGTYKDKEINVEGGVVVHFDKLEE